jgi:hypothetical protein
MNKELNPFHISWLLNKEYPEEEYLVDKLVPARGLTVFSGAPGAMKTWLILEMAVNIASGQQFLGEFRTEQSNILFIDEENGENLVAKRLKMLTENRELPIYFSFLENFRLGESSIQQVIRYSQKRDISLVVFDSLVRIHTKDENSAIEMAQVFALLKELTKANITVLFTHHHRKQGSNHNTANGDSMRGSSDILASVDSHIAVSKSDNDRIVLTQTKLRLDEKFGSFIVDFSINRSEIPNKVSFSFVGRTSSDESKVDELKAGVLDIFDKADPPLFQKQIAEQLRGDGYTFSDKTLRNALKELEKEKLLIVKSGQGENKTLYWLNSGLT